MRVLEKVQSKDVIFIDIETVSVEENLVEGTPLYDAWSYKARYANELNKKTGLQFTIEDYFKEKAALYAPFAKVICITVGFISEKAEKTTAIIKSYYGDDEKELLETFNLDIAAICAKNPSTVLCGLNNIGFDEPFVFKRLIINGIKPCKILDSSGLKPWETTSIDLGKLFQGTSFYPDSLVAIATAMGLPSPKDGIDGSMVTEFYYGGKLNDIVKYCERDVITTINIFRKFKFEPIIEDVVLRTQAEKELPAPFLQRLYMSKNFNDDYKKELLTLTHKKLTPDSKKHLIDILLSVYIEKKDKVGEKKAKTLEIEEFVNTLK